MNEEQKPKAPAVNEVPQTKPKNDTPGTVNKVKYNPKIVAQMMQTTLNKAKDDPTRASYISDIKAWRDAYNRKSTDDTRTGLNNIVLGDTLSTCRWWVANLMDVFNTTDELVGTKPYTADAVNNADKSRELLNFQFNRQMDKVTLESDAFTTLCVDGMVVAEVGWQFEEIYTNAIKLNGDKVLDVPVMESVGYEMAHMKLDKDAVPSEVIMGEKKPTKDRPIVRIHQNERVYLDPSARDIADVKFYIVERDITISDLKKMDTQYNPKGTFTDIDKYIQREKQIARAKVETDSNEPTQMDDFGRTVITIYEYWGELELYSDEKQQTGITQQMVVTFLNDGETILRCEQNPFPDNEPPFIVSFFHKEPHTKYGKGIPYFVMLAQEIRSSIMNAMLDKNAYDILGSWIANERSMTPDQEKVFKEARPGSLIYVKDVNTIKPIQNIPLQPDNYRLLEYWHTQLENESGFTRYSQGLDSSSLNKTATGVSAIMEQSQKRVLEVAIRVSETFFRPMFRKIHALNQALLDQTTIIALTGEPMQVNNQDIQGMFDYDFAINVRGIKQSEIQNLVTLMGYISPLATPDQTGISPVPISMVIDIIGRIAEKMGEKALTHQLKQYKTQAEQRQQMAAQMMQAQTMLQNDAMATQNMMAGAPDIAAMQTQQGGM